MTVQNVRIRMYRQGFGDCFLLTFTGSGPDKPFHLLIDFGVYSGQAMMADIAENILAETGGRVDLLVVTHEHKDHVSGFLDTDLLQHLTIDQLWLAWTEDPNDLRAMQLQRDKLAFTGTLEQAFTALAAAPGLADKRATVADLLDFEGVTVRADGSAMGADGSENKTKAALDAVKKRATADRTTYLLPGQVKSLKASTGDALAGVQVYVLGPPRKSESLKLMARKADLYPDEEADTAATRFSLFSWAAGMAAAPPANADTDTDADEFTPDNSPAIDSPFGEGPLVIRPESGKLTDKTTARTVSEFDRLKQKYFGKPDDKPGDKSPGVAKRNDQTWRDVSFDWLGVSEGLALQLNTYTNNTSLVLAIELNRLGQVLLFPGDAQLGNWLSWSTVEFRPLDAPASALPVVARPGQQPPVTSDDLLRRTVFYKVGHHGSHNATPRGAGLEKMTNPNLVAMMPVSHKMIANRDWPIPFESLRKRLFEKTNNQCVRADFSDPEVNDTVKPVFQTDPLFIDYNVIPELPR